tara:strand:- start:87 stop:500 length:414 start_codon:yes stop_codon:yes gene_type:complete
MENNMKIERMNKGSWGKVRAFFDLATQEGFTIKGFKIIEGINGLFVSMPSQKSNDGEYYDSVFASKELRDELNKFALDAYGSQSNEAMQGGLETGGSADTNMPTKEPTNEINADFVSKEEENKAPSKQPFSDEDIPF